MPANRPPHLLLIGPPGSGKSTLSARLAAGLPLTIIASGQRLRDEIAQGSPIGHAIAARLAAGHFAPDSLMEQLMQNWLAAIPTGQGFLLDGFPRNVAQAVMLAGMLNQLDRPLDGVLLLDVSAVEATRRLNGRRICEGGGAPFTLHIDDAAAQQRCHERGGRLVARPDDRPEVIAERLRVYEQETRPLLDHYTAQSLLLPLDGHGTPAAVAERALTTIQKC